VNTTIERPDGSNLYVVYTDSNTHTTHHLFLFLSLSLLLYASFFSEAARTCTHFPQMRSVVVDHAIATIAPAPCCSRACSPRRTSRSVACHARRRCDGPCEWVAFRVRIRMQALRMPSNASRRQPPSSAAAFVTLRARHRTARTGTSRDGHAPENARTDPHGMGYVCRYTPTSRLVLRAAVTAEYLDGAFRRETRRETRVEATSNPGVS
jgi:hypothetical protein